MSEGDGGLGLILMSERELQRIEVLSKVLEQRMTVVSAAHVLDMTTRQAQRLLKAADDANKPAKAPKAAKAAADAAPAQAKSEDKSEDGGAEA